jgi:hypothetical protein
VAGTKNRVQKGGREGRDRIEETVPVRALEPAGKTPFSPQWNEHGKIL